MPGPAHAPLPRAAMRETKPIPLDADPRNVVARELEKANEAQDIPGLHTLAIGVDPRQWEVVRFTLWEHSAPAEAATKYCTSASLNWLTSWGWNTRYVCSTENVGKRLLWI